MFEMPLMKEARATINGSCARILSIVSLCSSFKAYIYIYARPLSCVGSKTIKVFTTLGKVGYDVLMGHGFGGWRVSEPGMDPRIRG